jgi:SAM-dependent methyltransferase
MNDDDLWTAAIVATAALVGLEVLTMPMGSNLRLDTIAQARAYAREVKKPVINVGCCGIGIGGIAQQDPRVRSAGEVNVDMRHTEVEVIDGAVHMPGDIYHLPFADKAFGAAVASHILEHLDDPDAALQELGRVADRVFVVLPYAWLPSTWLYPDHRWVFLFDDPLGPRIRIRP